MVQAYKEDFRKV